MPNTHAPIEVFCFYAREDASLFQKLEAHLRELQQQGLVSIWHDRQISPGADRVQTIGAHLNSASIILILISSDFLASDYCGGAEMQRILQRHEAKEVLILPVLLRPVDPAGNPFAHLQALPTGAGSITSWRNRDEAFVDVAQGLRRAIQDLMLRPASTSDKTFPSVCNVPYQRNPFFTGQEELLGSLHEQLRLELELPDHKQTSFEKSHSSTSSPLSGTQ